MRITVISATLESALVLLWIMSFVRSGAVGSPHQHWYVELPSLFLLVPIATAIVAIGIRKREEDWRLGIFTFLLILLAANLVGFGVYAVLSGGGV